MHSTIPCNTDQLNQVVKATTGNIPPKPKWHTLLYPTLDISWILEGRWGYIIHIEVCSSLESKSVCKIEEIAVLHDMSDNGIETIHQLSLLKGKWKPFDGDRVKKIQFFVCVAAGLVLYFIAPLLLL